MYLLSTIVQYYFIWIWVVENKWQNLFISNKIKICKISFIISTSYQNQWIEGGGGAEAHKNMCPYLLKFVDVDFVVNVDVS